MTPHTESHEFSFYIAALLVTFMIFEIFALLGCRAAWIGGYLATFRVILSVPYSRIK